MMKPGLGLIQSGMRTAWLAETQPEGLALLGNKRMSVPRASAK